MWYYLQKNHHAGKVMMNKELIMNGLTDIVNKLSTFFFYNY